MAKVFLTCFAPFKSLFSDEIAIGLFSSLEIDLSRLQKSLENKLPSLQWCSEAMFVIKKIHSYFLLYLEESKVPASWEGLNMLDEYMRATIDLLDFCNLLKSATSSLDRYRMMVDFTVKRLEEAAFSSVTSKTELERLERETSNKLFDAKKWGEMNFNKEGVSKVKLKTKGSMHVLQAIGTTMSMVSLLIICVILHPVPVKINEGWPVDSFSNSIFDSVQKLLATFTDRFHSVQGKGRSILYENEMITDALTALKEQVVLAGEAGVHKVKLPETAAMIKKRSMALKEGLNLFECIVNELFEEVIKGRKWVIELMNANHC